MHCMIFYTLTAPQTAVHVLYKIIILIHNNLYISATVLQRKTRLMNDSFTHAFPSTLLCLPLYLSLSPSLYPTLCRILSLSKSSLSPSLSILLCHFLSQSSLSPSLSLSHSLSRSLSPSPLSLSFLPFTLR